ncbi:MAG: hypothetical protein UV82_C0011G0015 [Candidatus Magasanikbacteria bacterium GW2011_GWD2_43_18]|uniref:Sugar 3,4-ketoisomerase QdtA cupin domain-containing protein n=1 Tax=Candidatus Magasanikbacteria bacterium GW2011_GWE2_42_7 TaxID=1619052 RepID=A0A0G1BD04_9BACT|nr:MAG: hypothetical protein UV18_C0007G0017 [Candidatus Magasanikbacteria bacterium GW2011_GWC2_42_27]KKS71250.1 MAG: hypothetical protein UV42_C0033G0006 [Candidatus Magasanikbacteria bacterium GW2011_GWE2_42_7]KKT04087.1 MAG: hypothetical protein UV82_C0011G0015 [Candidatus Magasanikbacteria bacterium GW2011_GWD2_43_18]KKT24636.1 MAG: hypothetical protein UW10_C0022G0016 [Candidatus Magasanikbacteria bacterium GW2011_GWA2_43_9]HBB38551.1 hypothetical protein [Candidatus Magasanikbacteria bac
MRDEPFVTTYHFHKDDTKKTRVLESVRVGGVYITRMIIFPKAIIGNLYFTKTNMVFFAQVGELDAKFIQPSSGKEKMFHLEPDSGIVHVPPYVAFAIKNRLDTESVLVSFSDEPLHDRSDDVPFDVFS